MRTFFRFLAWLIGALALLVVLALVAAYSVSSRLLHRQYTVAVAAVPIPTDAGSITRGKHLASIRGCMVCHGADFGGAKVIEDFAMGRFYGPNLTRGGGGLGPSLSGEDWVRAVRQGVATDHHGLVLMPSKDYTGLSDGDLGEILAYIQTVPPVDRVAPAISVGPLYRALLSAGKIRLSADMIDHTHPVAVAEVAIAVSPAYGRYLAAICTGCHNPNFSGGKIADGPPDWPPAANLTRGAGSAVAGWSEADFISTLRTAKTPEGKAVDPVMPKAFAQMNDVELKAIWAYLQTLAPAATAQAPAATL